MKKEVYFLLSKEKQIKNFTQKKKSIHTCNQHTRMNTPHSVRLAQKLKAKKKKRGYFPPKKHTYTRVCYTTKACAHIPLQKKRKKKVYKMEPIDILFIHSFSSPPYHEKTQKLKQ